MSCGELPGMVEMGEKWVGGKDFIIRWWDPRWDSWTFGNHRERQSPLSDSWVLWVTGSKDSRGSQAVQTICHQPENTTQSMCWRLVWLLLVIILVRVLHGSLPALGLWIVQQFVPLAVTWYFVQPHLIASCGFLPPRAVEQMTSRRT